jgi:hypothetical protein
MQAIRCSCGATHAPNAVQQIGRQYGLDGEYMDLGNCPACGSTICVASGTFRVARKRTSTRVRATG